MLRAGGRIAAGPSLVERQQRRRRCASVLSTNFRRLVMAHGRGRHGRCRDALAMPSDTRAHHAHHLPLDPADAAAVDGVVPRSRRRRTAHDIPTSRHRAATGSKRRCACRGRARRTLRWVARDGGDVVGYLDVDLPTLDNLDNALVEVDRAAGAPPAGSRPGPLRARRRRSCAPRAADGSWRSPRHPLPGGGRANPAASAFAAAMGMTTRWTRSAAGSTCPPWTRPASTRCSRRAGRRPTGTRWCAGQHRLPRTTSTTSRALDSGFLDEAPLGDLAWEPEKVDAAGSAPTSSVREQLRRTEVSTAARHDATGRIVALSGAGAQDETTSSTRGRASPSCDPDHRGHRLGPLVEDREPAVRDGDELPACATSTPGTRRSTIT